MLVSIGAPVTPDGGSFCLLLLLLLFHVKLTRRRRKKKKDLKKIRDTGEESKYKTRFQHSVPVVGQQNRSHIIVIITIG
jgi:hypothetical protein